MFPPLSNGLKRLKVLSGPTIIRTWAFESHKPRYGLKNKGSERIFTQKPAQKRLFSGHGAKFSRHRRPSLGQVKWAHVFPIPSAPSSVPHPGCCRDPPLVLGPRSHGGG